MKIKFNLNKYCKLDNIENYSMDTIRTMQEVYEEYLKDTDGVDIDFPGFTFNKSKDSVSKKSGEIYKKNSE